MESILIRFQAVRATTVNLVHNLSAEDTVVQPTEEVSPPKWHLAHTTWFFENFVLKNFYLEYKPLNIHYDYLFNSYYEGQGTRVKRNMRGFHPRPLLREVIEYRLYVDNYMVKLLSMQENNDKLVKLVELGIHHEQQHQELLLSDLKYIWSFSPMHPVYTPPSGNEEGITSPMHWLEVKEGLYSIGESGSAFHFDNESPQHQVFLNGFEIASRAVTVGEYLEFMNDRGYEQWKYWLHEGWLWIREHDIQSPLYWNKIDGNWHIYTLSGLRQLDEQEILTHVSFYEADAFARWKDARLPTEQEWEIAAKQHGTKDVNFNFLDNGIYHPNSVSPDDTAFLGQTWEWTNSAYLPYPRFKPWAGDIGEYNGKFMVNQMVLRGGSCITPHSHIRLTYRNFFHPHSQWQFTGIRLAKDLF